MRQYVSGEALQTIESLGHSATAYEAAKERLERKYGGRRRQIAVYLEDLENFKQVRSGNARELEQLADLLDIAIINLKEAGHFHELGDGSLYNKCSVYGRDKEYNPDQHDIGIGALALMAIGTVLQ